VSGLKVMTILGTRPEIIKLSRVVAALDAHTEHVLVHTGQNYDYELNEVFFEELGIRKPDRFLEAAGKSPAATIGNVIARSDDVLADENPDAVLILGDTNSALAALSAKRRKVPIFHMEAGNRCFDQRVPEEINRKIVDHVSDINLTYTEHARRYLLAEGIRPETVIKTGSPMREVLEFHRTAIEGSAVLADLDLAAGEFCLVSMHREENVDVEANLRRLIECLNAVAARFEKTIVLSTHPRTRARLEEFGLAGALDERVRQLKPLGFFDYVRLQTRAFCTISDSGTITEESAILNFPAVTIRNTHERPEGMDEARVVMTGLAPERVLGAVEVVVAQQSSEEPALLPVADYAADNVSTKVVRLILSYTDYVNRTVWHRDEG
jgi:UDP-N-acetylglucosamine 2-epimerase (non-hydrolysing)